MSLICGDGGQSVKNEKKRHLKDLASYSRTICNLVARGFCLGVCHFETRTLHPAEEATGDRGTWGGRE